MTDSFQKTLPADNKVSASPATAAPPPSKVAPGLSRPANSIPNKPNQVTTSGAPTPQAQAQTAAKPPAKVPFNLSLSTLNNAKSILGSAIGTGYGVYNAYQQSPLGMLSGLTGYLGNPTNFANTLGALAPIASPLMRTAGLPLLFGAYSALKDKNYLNDLTAGRFPKMGAALPPAAPAKPVVYGPAPQPFNFKFRPGQFIKPGPTRDPVVAPPQAFPKIEEDSTAKLRHIAGEGVRIAPAVGALGNNLVRNPVRNKFINRGLNILTGLSDLASLPERVQGVTPNTLDQTISKWEKARDPFEWAQGLVDTYNDPQKGRLQKTLEMTEQALGNPYIEAFYNPIGNAFVVAKGINDWTGAGNAVHALSGGKYGQPATGNTLSVPVAVGQMMHLSHGKGKPIGSLYR